MNQRKIKFIYFDLGSTLLDETDTFNSMIQKSTAGSDISMPAFYSMMEHEKYSEITKRLKLKDVPFESELEKLYKSTVMVLEGLGRYPKGILANQPADLEGKLKKHGILQYFDVIIGSDDVGLYKPDPEIFKLAVKKSGVLPENILMVGDRLDNDIYPAKKAGMMAAWVRQGFDKNQTPRIADIEYVFDSIDDILKVL